MELIYFYPVVNEHGLSKWWLYKQLSKLSKGVKRGLRASGKCTASFLVPYEEMMHLIFTASKRKSVETILHQAWTVIYGKRMTYLASRSHGTWQRHYRVPRREGRIAISQPQEFFALRPRFRFFTDNKEDLQAVLSPLYFEKLFLFLETIERDVRKYIQRKSSSRDIQETLSSIDYEQFYELMLDELLYGHDMESAFESALRETPKRSDKGSSKECNTKVEGGIERFGTPQGSSLSASFQMDFKKLRQKFGETLAALRIQAMSDRKKSRLTKEDKKKAACTAEEDLSIFDWVLEGLTDAEILERLGLTCTRQALTMRRSWIMEMAKEHFQHLLD